MDGTYDVLLITCADSHDKDVMSLLHANGYDHTTRMTFLGYSDDGRYKVYRSERITGIGHDPDGLASRIRSYWPGYPDYANVRECLQYLPRSVVRTLVGMLRHYKRLGHNPRLDLHSGNYATTDDGRFILLDPFYRG